MRLLFLGSFRFSRRFEFGQRLFVSVVFGVCGLESGEIVGYVSRNDVPFLKHFAARSSDDAMIARSSNWRDCNSLICCCVSIVE